MALSSTSAFGIPTVTLILAWLSNKTDIGSRRAHNKALRAGMVNLRKEIYEALIPMHKRMAVIGVKQK